MIEFAPTLGEDALIGRAPVRPRGRSSSSSINNHSISSKQQRSSSITNSPDPSIITSDAAEPTAAGSRGANCVVMADLRRLGGPPVGTDQGAGDTGARSEEHLQREGDSQSLGGPFGGHCQETRGYRSAQRLVEHSNLEV